MGQVKLDFEFLHRLAHYYEFPFTAFWCDKKEFPKRQTRYRALLKRIEDMKNKLEEIIDEN